MNVVVATTDIKPNSLIKPGMVAMRSFSADTKPANAIGNFNAVNGYAALREIPAGAVIPTDAVSLPNPALGLAYAIPKNMRAVSVSLDPVSGVAGFLKPGDHVDVLATYTTQNQENITKTVMQDAELLAIGSQPSSTVNYQGANGAPAISNKEDANKANVEAPTATLAVMPDQAQNLVLAQAKAKIQLVLRPPDDQAITPITPTTSTKVFGGGARPTATAAPSPPPYQPISTLAHPTPPPSAPSAPMGETSASRRQQAPAPSKPVVVTRGTQQTNVDVP